MNIWKKIFGIGLAVGLSVGMSISPVYADTISILDRSLMKKQQRTMQKIHQQFWQEVVI